MRKNIKTVKRLRLSIENPALYKTFKEREFGYMVKMCKKKLTRDVAKCKRLFEYNQEASAALEEYEANKNLWHSIENPYFFEKDEDYTSLISFNGPIIYGFITEIVDDYVKTGYTLCYTAEERVDQWRKIKGGYPDAKLIAAYPASVVCDGIRLCFDDLDVHERFERVKFKRASKEIFGEHRYSKEFFKNINETNDLKLFNFSDTKKEFYPMFFEDVMNDIYATLEDETLTFTQKKAQVHHLKKYGDLITTEGEKAKILDWELTDEQFNVIKKGVESLGLGNTELLLAAIMRFGKSAVSYRIMLEYFKPTEISGAKHLIVSGKDTRETWQKDFFHKDIIEKTEEKYNKGAIFMWYEGKAIHWCGNIKDKDGYHKVYYLSGPETKPKREITKEVFDELSKDNVIFFYVSFQDIYGEKEDGKAVYKIKDKHEVIFNTIFDSIIIDETHFGARSKVFGAVLDGEDKVIVDDEDVRPIKCKAHLHLSATPYKILASNEFKSEKHDIIGVITLADIYRFKEEWAEKNPGRPEWENPYFGTPQLHTLLLNLPNEVMDKISANGDSFFAELFAPKNAEDNSKLSLKHRKEVTAVFSYLFGSIKARRDGLIRNSTVSKNGVMKHIVIPLPDRKACEMVYSLLTSGCIAGMDEYDIYKLSGYTNLVGGENELNSKLWESEKAGRKTITLTCDKCTTGSTINLWDTMLYFKDGDSAEYYDQTWGRILSRAVVDVLDENGNPTGEKACIKNHVYFIDFKPNRAVEMRYKYITQMRDYFLSLGTEEGNKQAELVRNEIKYYLMCRLDDFTEINDFDSLTREYHKTFVETDSHGVNYQANKLCDVLMSLSVLKSCGLSAFSGSKETGIVMRTRRGEGLENGNPIIGEYPGEGNGETDGQGGPTKPMNKKSKEEKKERATMMEIINGISNLSIACTERVTTAEELLNVITGEKAVAYKSLAHFSDICKVLEASCEQNGFFTIEARTSLNNFINEKNSLVSEIAGYDEKARIEVADKYYIPSIRDISNNERVAPSNIVDLQNDKLINHSNYRGGTILDDKTYGEYTLGLCKFYGVDFAREFVYTLPSSDGARIFVEKLYDILGLDKSHILNDNIIKDKNMHFNGLTGNPPYQGDSSKQLYPGFYKTAKEIADNVSLIFPMEWQKPNNQPAKGLGYMYKEEVRCDERIIHIDNLSGVFKGVQGAQDVNIILWSKSHRNGLNGCQLIKPVNGTEYEVTNLKNCFDTTSDKPEELKELARIVSKYPGFKSAVQEVSAQKPYGMDTNVLSKYPQYFTNEQNEVNQIKLYAGDPDKDRGSGYVERYMPKSAECLKVSKTAAPILSYKLLFPKQWGNMTKNWLGGTFSDILIASPNEICTQKYQTAFPCDSAEDIKKASKLAMSRFARGLMLVKKNKKGAARGVFEYVPVQDFHEDFWNSDDIDYIDECLFDKYGVPENIREFIRKNIQPRTIDNIENYHTVK